MKDDRTHADKLAWVERMLKGVANKAKATENVEWVKEQFEQAARIYAVFRLYQRAGFTPEQAMQLLVATMGSSDVFVGGATEDE